MIATNTAELELIESWNDVDPDMRVRFFFPLHAAAGTEASSVVYFEVEPGKSLAIHRDGAEEILYVVDGEGVLVVDGEEAEVGPGSLAVVPKLAPHGVRSTGSRTLKVVGFFAAAELEHYFDDPIQPLGATRVTTPPAGVLA